MYNLARTRARGTPRAHARHRDQRAPPTHTRRARSGQRSVTSVTSAPPPTHTLEVCALQSRCWNIAQRAGRGHGAETTPMRRVGMRHIASASGDATVQSVHSAIVGANGGAALVLGAGSPARAPMRKPLTQVPTTPYLALSPPAHPRHTLHALPCPRHTHTHSPTHNRPHAPTPAWLMHMPCTHAQTRAASTHKLYAARRSSSSEQGRRGGVGAWPGGHHCWPVGL